jgi:uncharacterized membrane protein YphA (DoxX/SURF4 family)
MVIVLLTLKSRIVPKLALIFIKLHVPLESILFEVIVPLAILEPLISALVAICKLVILLVAFILLNAIEALDDMSPSTIVPSAI